MTSKTATRRRHKRFDITHQDMIETAVRLISEKGIAAVSIAVVSRTLGVNRTTAYYHFESREALIEAVKVWSSEQIARAFNARAPQHERIDYITRFVLNHPELIKLWIEDLISEGDIRRCYPHWDALVKGVRKNLAVEAPGDRIDAEVYSVILLAGAIIGPRIFKNRVCPNADTETVVRRFRLEEQRLLKHNALLRPAALTKASRDRVPRRARTNK